MYYRSENKSVCADVIPYYENGTFYLYYLKDFRDIEQHGEGCPWCLLTTKDFVSYEEHGEVLVRGTEEEQDLYVFTGSCSKFNGEYYIFYTGHNPHKRVAGLPEQKILLAKSKDLYHWEKIKDFSLEAPEWLEIHDFRDPFVYWDEESGKYCMLIAGRLKDDAQQGGEPLARPKNAKGVTLLLTSDDLYHWELDREPFYAPNAFFTHECPDLFKMGDWWYLVFSEFTDRVVTTYRMAKTPFGPWQTPKVNNFDAHAFYAAKTASDGKRRFLFGWNCIKNQEKDTESWQWGGTIIPHELVQAEDGTLYVKCPEEIRNAYSGQEICSIEKIAIGSNSERSLKLLGQMPENCRITAEFTVLDDIGDFGLLLRADGNADEYYAVKFEPKFNRLCLDQQPRVDSTRHVQVDVERYCPVEVGVKNTLLVIVEGSVLEVYVNDRVAMSARMFDRKEGQLGVYAQFTAVEFENLAVTVSIPMKKYDNRTLWYKQPAAYWEEALPIGNGRLGAMVFGGIEEDIFRMNEDTFWSGYPKKCEIKNGPEHFRKARDLALAGDYRAAEMEVEKYLEGEYTDCYLPLGDIRLEFPELCGKEVSAYERYLCLKTAVSGSEFVCEGVKYQKECFVSAPEQAMFVRLSTDQKETLNFRISMSGQVKCSSSIEGGKLLLTGIAPGYAAPGYFDVEDPIRYSAVDAEKGMRFCMILDVETDGCVETEAATISVKNAQFALLRICAATSFNGFDKHPFLEGKDELACCFGDLSASMKQTYEEAKIRHIEDYRSYFDRMELQVSFRDDGACLPTDERLRSFYKKSSDLGMYELLFHFGRYLMISSSRPGTQATNLQGIWNPHMRAPWSSNYTININTEMNYWPAEICGFPELHEPLFDLIRELSVSGKNTAKMVYGADGFVSHHNTDLWRLSTPVGRCGDNTAGYAFWPMSFGWLCRHLYEHYEFTMDEKFLRETAYPLLCGAAQFYLDVLAENADGKLVFAPTTSPENRYLKEDFHGAVVQSAAMTQSIVAEVFDSCLKSASVLGEENEWLRELEQKRKQLLDLQIGSDGRLLEWNEELEEPEVQHRHISHLYALYPGNAISPDQTPELADACRRSLEVRGDVGTGWSLGWKVNTWARLHDGDHALKILREQLRYVAPEGAEQKFDYSNGGGTYPNLFDAHPPFQIDGNFGTTAGMAEMFVQSTPDEIRLLPAVPSQFTEAVVKGIRAKGGVTVDVYMEHGTMTEAMLVTDRTQEKTVIYRGKRVKILLEAGIPYIFFGPREAE